MASGLIDTAGLHCTGRAGCVGGKHPDPPLDAYPLLAWMVGHDDHGSKVFTEDGRATVEAIAVALPEHPDLHALAAKFGTTADHASQAVAYALAAGFLAR